jgi:hypothetical protein
MTPAEIRQYHKELETRMPDLWAQLYPRVYEASPKCGEFCGAKEPAHFFLGRIAAEKVRTPDPYSVVAKTLIKYAMPQTWISTNMAEAILHTTPPMDLDWTAMRLPFPAMVLMIPRGILPAIPGHHDTNFLVFCRHSQPNQAGVLEHEFIFLTCTDQAVSLSSFYGAEPIIPLGNLKGFYDDFVEKAETIPADVESKESHHAQAMAMNLCFGALLIMEERPELVTAPRLLRAVPRKGEDPKYFWSPHILGEHYQIRREPGLGQGGHHRSPRHHWVRGSYKQQAYGPDMTLRKRIWVEPYCRGD